MCRLPALLPLLCLLLRPAAPSSLWEVGGLGPSFPPVLPPPPDKDINIVSIYIFQCIYICSPSQTAVATMLYMFASYITPLGDGISKSCLKASNHYLSEIAKVRLISYLLLFPRRVTA
jgi:hypothetical protein